VVILSPFNPLRFIKEVRGLIAKNIERHTVKINEQHIEIANYISKLLKSESDRPSLFYYRQQMLIIKLLIFAHFEHEELFMLSHNFLDTQEHIDHYDITRAQIRLALQEQNSVNVVGNIGELKHRFYHDIADDKAYISFVKALTAMLL